MSRINTFVYGVVAGMLLSGYPLFKAVDDVKQTAVKQGFLTIDDVRYELVKSPGDTQFSLGCTEDGQCPEVVVEVGTLDCSPAVEIQGEIWPGSCPEEWGSR